MRSLYAPSRLSAVLLLLFAAGCHKDSADDSDVKVVNGMKVLASSEVAGAGSAIALAAPQGKGFAYFCSGNIIGNRWILTAQHCVDGKDPSNLLIIFATDVNQASAVVQRSSSATLEADILKKVVRRVEAIHRAPGYVSPAAAEHEWLAEANHYQIRLKADVALIKLTEDIPAGYQVAQIPYDAGLATDSVFDFVGYGSFNDKMQGGGVRRTTPLRVNGATFDGGPVGNVQGRIYQLVKTVDNEYMCRGDSGGGLYRTDGDTTYLLGINSYTKGSNKTGYVFYDCAAGLAHMFYAPDYKAWIKSIAGNDVP